MPLPGNVKLSLQGHSRPGDAVQTKHKQAMIVRMTAETLDALADHPNNPRMDFQFGGNTGIHIGDTFFPMISLQEKTPHELYLRTSSATKPNAPLKLYASVIGKFTVERELEEKAAVQIRDRTVMAEKQRSERKAIMLDTPPVLPSTNGKKKKAPLAGTTAKWKMTQIEHGRKPLAPSAVPARVASPLPPSTNDQNINIRRRVIHCLATSPRTTDDVVRLVGGSNCSATTRKIILDILAEAAQETPQPKNSRAPRTLEPQNHAWREVRPWSWAALSESDRISMARRARLIFGDLGIPADDPAWEHVRHRAAGPILTPVALTSTAPAASGGTNATASGSKATPATKPKEKKAKGTNVKTKTVKVEITAKDESIRPSSAKPKESPLALPAAGTAGSRRVPGAGSKTTSAAPIKTESPAPLPPGAGPSRRTGPVDARRDKRREEPKPSGPARAAPPIPTPVVVKEEKKVANGGTKVTKKVKAAPEAVDRGLSSKAKDAGQDRLKTKREEQARIKKEEQALDARRQEQSVNVKREEQAARVKRKKAIAEDEESESDRDAGGRIERNGKKRKTDGAPRREVDRAHEMSPPKKSLQRERERELEPSPRPLKKIKRNESPVFQHPDKDMGRSSDKPRGSASSKATRRKSPIYTSSEGETDPSPPRNKHAHSQPTRSSRLPSGPLPTDHEALRARYSTSYQQYLNCYSKMVSQKSKMDQILRKSSKNGAGDRDAVITDVSDDGDGLMDVEELQTLSVEHRKWKEELESIKRAFEGSHGSASSSE